MFKVIKPEDILMSTDHTKAITTKDNIELIDYKELSWNEFIDLTIVAELKTRKRRFNTKHLREIKTILGIFCMDTGSVIVKVHEEPLPLVFELDEQYVILMSQFGVPINIGGNDD